LDGNTVLLVGLGLLAAALLLVIAEVFLPSAGLLSIGAGAAAIAGIIVLFKHPDGPTWGFIGVGLVLVGAPAAISMALKVWPSTPIGKKMLQGEVTEEQLEAQRRVEIEARERRRALVGAEGEVITPLRPVGVVRIADQRYDALAETGIIETGQRVRVTAVQDHQIKVRAV
jgi:membrane-bound ClpP family serine protease